MIRLDVPASYADLKCEEQADYSYKLELELFYEK